MLLGHVTIMQSETFLQSTREKKTTLHNLYIPHVIVAKHSDRAVVVRPVCADMDAARAVLHKGIVAAHTEGEPLVWRVFPFVDVTASADVDLTLPSSVVGHDASVLVVQKTLRVHLRPGGPRAGRDVVFSPLREAIPPREVYVNHVVVAFFH